MIKNLVVEVSSRSDFGKNSSRRLRREGQVPGIVYGLNVDPYAVSVPPRRIEKVLLLDTGVNTIFKLALEDQETSRAVMIREIQRDPVTEDMVHIDFVRVDLDKPVQIQVPLILEGTPKGVKEGGILDQIHRTIHIESLPEAIPDGIHFDVSQYNLGDTISVESLTAPEGCTILDPVDTVIASIYEPKAEEEPEVEEAEADEVAADADAAPQEGEKAEGEEEEPSA